MNATRRPMAERGFTLVEVLVALLMMAVLASMAWQGIDGIARSRSIADERLEQTLRLNAVLAQWQQDLQSLHDGTAVPTLRFDGANVQMVRDAEGGVQVVVWSLRSGQWHAGPGRRWCARATCRNSGCAASNCWATSRARCAPAVARAVAHLLLSRERLDQRAVERR